MKLANEVKKMNINLATENLKKNLAKQINDSQVPPIIALFVLQQLTTEAHAIYAKVCQEEAKATETTIETTETVEVGDNNG